MKHNLESRKALVAPFLERGERTPDQTWARSVHDTRTFGESRERVLALAARLSDWGLPAGSLAALVVGSTPNAIEALAALWLAELVPVLVDPTAPADAERRIAARLGARLAWRPPLDWHAEPVLDDSALVSPDAPRARPEAAAVKLSSGSAGDPKGVLVSAAALDADTRALVACLGLWADDRALVAVPLSHSYGFSVLTLPALTHGLPLLFPADRGVLEAARALGATFLPSVPAWYRSILAHVERAELAPTLRLLVSAGAPLEPEVARAFRERFGLPIHALYGASECGSIAYDRTGDATERGHVGTLLDGVAVELRDGDPGLVTVTSPANALGYLPERAGDRGGLRDGRFHSEDLARWVDGELRLCGRRSEWINVRGRNVDPRAVEAAIGEHPNVDEVVVLPRPGAGRGDQTLRAVIVRRAAPMGYMDVVEWCRPRLAPYQLPRSVVFVDELPRTARGKIDRDRLIAL